MADIIQVEKESYNLEPKVSIIIPVYNCEEYLRETLECVQVQIYQNIEVLLVDDGSTDSSGDLCDRFAADDVRFHAFHLKNGGVSYARNFGLDHLTGDYVMFIDSDDLVKPEYVDIMVHAAMEMQANVVICQHFNGHKYPVKEFKEYNCNLSPSKTRILLSDDNPLDIAYCHDNVWGAIYAAVLIDKGRFDTELCMGEDTLFFYQMFRKAGEIIVLEERLYYYRYRAESVYHGGFSEKNFDEVRAREKILTLFDDETPIKTEFCAITGYYAKKNLINAIISRYPDHQCRRKLYLKALKYCGSVFKSKGMTYRSKLAYLLFLGCPLIAAKWKRSSI